uniref:Uncharacterized protein n=1 Tax=Candidatus Kentrum sp. MB TaxID=2138164 RepID=A0A450Y218_9GAMM|nr:MAG: hypothetical protein BECKMB1821G_GA0114241_10443 [Candidatus Kentron sp. MB]VFK35597.1 MAG: hypothetical protein BECKMB1821I_GA0114274_11309 [Candidatus Kentron sp. MB]VFK77373.1 MAG: hypothetical protein BECKMB1821H_GA0114242_11299 [Candidatus Kentron sp. MB]
MKALWIGIFSISTMMVWFLWGKSILRRVVHKKSLDMDHKCIKTVINNEIDESHESTIKNLLLFALLIPVAYLLPSIDMAEIWSAILSKGAKSGNIFGKIEQANVLALPALVVLFSLIAYIMKFRIINKAISCLKDVKCG